MKNSRCQSETEDRRHKMEGYSNLNELKKLKTCWEYLSETKLPIFIYGMGDGCLKLMREFAKYNIAVSGIFASDEFVRGHSFQGHLVHRLSEIEEKLGCGGFVIAMAFAAGYQSLIAKIDELAKRSILLFPDTDVIGTGAFTKDFFADNFESFERVYGLLSDERSRQTFCDVLSFKLTGRIEYLRRCTSLPDEAYRNIIRPGSDEVYVDAGAYNGDTVRELLMHTGGSCRRIYALEPDKRSFRKLREYLECDKAKDNTDCRLFNAAAWNENTQIDFSDGGGRQSQLKTGCGRKADAVTIDSLLCGEKATYIKYDVEGAEMQALEGTRLTIQKYAPKLCVAVYHRSEDLFRIPLYLKSLVPSYKLYIRHYPYYPAWETNLFAVNE